MAVLSSTCCDTLLLSVDADLSSAFDRLVSESNLAATPTALFAHLPPRTHVTATRTVNAVAQTIVLTRAPPMPTKDIHTAPHLLRGSSIVEEDAYVVLLLDVQQVPPLLSSANAHRCPAHPSGTGPLGFYLDAVVDGVAQQIREAGTPLRAPSAHLNGGLMKTNQDTFVTVHLSIIVVPNATTSLDGLNSTNVNLTAKEAATLFSGAAAWSASFLSSSQDTTISCNDNNDTEKENMHVDTAALQKGCTHATLDLCTTATQPQQALQMIAALATKLLKKWTTAAAATALTNKTIASSGGAEVDAHANGEEMSAATSLSGMGAASAVADLKDVRPDTQRKCIPTDFHALYTSMLTEVSSFSERKTMAAVTAFPTMCHLLEYVEGVTGEQQQQQQPPSLSGVPGAVYSTNFGEQRSWNVLNSAIVEALVTEYNHS